MHQTVVWSHDRSPSAMFFVHKIAFHTAIVVTGICKAKHLVSPEIRGHANIASQGIKNIGKLFGRLYVLQLIAN